MGNIAEADFYNPKYYDNRELSWLKFNQRILNEARDTKLPLMERLSFLSITSSNLDEFFYGQSSFFKGYGSCRI